MGLLPRDILKLVPEREVLPDVFREFPGLSDEPALRFEIDQMRQELQGIQGQMALERELAGEIHSARIQAVNASPALEMIFASDDKSPDAEDIETKTRITMDDIVQSAFVRQTAKDTPGLKLPDGFTKKVEKDLRVSTHPDAGADIETVRNATETLNRIDIDPAFVTTSALLAKSTDTDDLDTLREERYALRLAIDGSLTNFDTVEEAETHAVTEVEGAEWRVRTVAALECLKLIIGDSETWNRFLKSIAEGQKYESVDMVNRLQPELLSIQERIAKGLPVSADALDTEAIDPILERIWSTLKRDEDSWSPYIPPYQNWLPILAPALRALDPGQRDGEEYTLFGPPIRVSRTPARQTTPYDEETSYKKNIFNDHLIQKEEFINDKNYY